MARRKKGEAVSGWVNLDKPYDFGSTQAVGRVRRIFNAQKAGHAGTLDPLATGILPIALGEATKTVSFLMDADKAYRFTIEWGRTTASFDREGATTATSDVRPTATEVEAVLPEFVGKYPQYERMGLRDLCDAIHSVYKANDVARVTTEMYLSDMEPAMKPSDAWAMMAHREIERVPVDELEGRVTAILLTPYPPGIPLLIPGERFNRTIVQYLKFAREFNKLFPGFETDIHGLVEDEVDGQKAYFVDCVKQ